MQLFFALKLIALFSTISSCATSESVWNDESEQPSVFTFRHAYANSHVIKLDETAFIMVDAGGYDQAPDLKEDLRENGIDPSLIKAIILTHGHWDHAAGAKYFQDKYQTPVLAGSRDRLILESGSSEALCPTSFFARWRVKDDEAVRFKPPTVARWIDSDTNIRDFVGFDVKIISVPSHTDGSLVVIVGKNAFVGDLFRGSILGSSPETHFYICDLAANRRLISEFLSKQGKDVVNLFTGHFGPVFGRSVVEKYFNSKN